MGRAFSPLDEELELLPGSLTPHAGECLARLGAWLPFESAAKLLAGCLRIQVSEATARRCTETAGAAFEAVQTTEAQGLVRDAPLAPAGPQRRSPLAGIPSHAARSPGRREEETTIGPHGALSPEGLGSPRRGKGPAAFLADGEGRRPLKPCRFRKFWHSNSGNSGNVADPLS